MGPLEIQVMVGVYTHKSEDPFVASLVYSEGSAGLHKLGKLRRAQARSPSILPAVGNLQKEALIQDFELSPTVKPKSSKTQRPQAVWSKRAVKQQPQDLRPKSPEPKALSPESSWVGPSSWTQIRVPSIVQILPLSKATLPLISS